jgi:hypothetical protein
LRIAECLPLQPELRGLIACSWFYSTALREVSPHLCWLRDFFAENGATIVEMEKAPADYGFMIGSARRRALDEKGRLRPRLTLILWSRADRAAWPARYRQKAHQCTSAPDPGAMPQIPRTSLKA